MRNYRSVEWRNFRAQVIELDGAVCQHCGRGRSDRVVLQVHHTRYQAGLQPWKYPLETCETVCSGCHARLHGEIPPNSGWELLGWDDLGSPDGVCDLCGTEIRYVFMIDHADWHPMEVGEVCCDTLTSTTDATQKMSAVRSLSKRRRRFVDARQWRVDESGGCWRRYLRHDIRVWPNSAGWELMIDRRLGKIRYDSMDAAKVKAFEVITNGAFDRFISRRHAGGNRRH